MVLLRQLAVFLEAKDGARLVVRSPCVLSMNYSTLQTDPLALYVKINSK